MARAAADVRARVLLIILPLEDADENAAMVNALQRHATVIVQKSLAEGFGFAVAEGMWKGRPAVGPAGRRHHRPGSGGHRHPPARPPFPTGLELLSALIGGPGFDPLLRGGIIAFPSDHPVYWWGCRITGCERPRRENKLLCAGHEAQCRKACLAGAARAVWLREAAPLALTYARVPEPCRVCGYRPAVRSMTRLCARHQHRWKDARGKAGGPGFGEWLTAQVPYDSYGGCRVAVCPELAYSPLGLCHGHESAYRFQGRPGGAEGA